MQQNSKSKWTCMLETKLPQVTDTKPVVYVGHRWFFQWFLFLLFYIFIPMSCVRLRLALSVFECSFRIPAQSLTSFLIHSHISNPSLIPAEICVTDRWRQKHQHPIEIVPSAPKVPTHTSEPTIGHCCLLTLPAPLLGNFR